MVSDEVSFGVNVNGLKAVPFVCLSRAKVFQDNSLLAHHQASTRNGNRCQEVVRNDHPVTVMTVASTQSKDS